MGRRHRSKVAGAAEPQRQPFGQKNRIADKTIVPELRPSYAETRACAANSQRAFDERYKDLFEQLGLRSVDLRQFVEAACGREIVPDAKLSGALKGAVADPLLAICQKVCALLDENAQLHETQARQLFTSHVKNEGKRYLDELTLEFQVTIETRQKLDHSYVAAADDILAQHTRASRATEAVDAVLVAVRESAKDLVTHVLDLDQALDQRRLGSEELEAAQNELTAQLKRCLAESTRYGTLHDAYAGAVGRLKELRADLERFDEELRQCLRLLDAFATCLEAMQIPPLTLSGLEKQEALDALFREEQKDLAWKRLQTSLPQFPEYKRLAEAVEQAGKTQTRLQALLTQRRAASPSAPPRLSVFQPPRSSPEASGTAVTPLHLAVCAYCVCCAPSPKTGNASPIGGRTAGVVYRLLAEHGLTFACSEESFVHAVQTGEERGLFRSMAKARKVGTWLCYAPTKEGYALAREWLAVFPDGGGPFVETLERALVAQRQAQESARQRFREEKGI